MAGHTKSTKSRKQGVRPKEDQLVSEAPRGGASDAKKKRPKTAASPKAPAEPTRLEPPEFPDTLPQRYSRRPLFFPEILDSTVITIPLLRSLSEEQNRMREDRTTDPSTFPVIIDLNLEYSGGRDGARTWVMGAIGEIIREIGRNKAPYHQGISEVKSALSQQYVFASLEGDVIREMVRRDSEPKEDLRIGAAPKNVLRAAYQIWPDFPIKSFVNKSTGPVKGDAANSSFSAFGEGIVWAVIDSGIEATHPHFELYDNLTLGDALAHRDLTRIGGDLTKLGAANDNDAERDTFGHGTHIAGIIAGSMKVGPQDAGTPEAKQIRAYARHRDEHGYITYDPVLINTISGMAPKCKLLSLKVLDDNGDGFASNLITALALIQELNGHGRRLLVHGVNISVGYEIEPEWQVGGHSPLQVEVNRLVKSGVVVVVADGSPIRGKSGYGSYPDDLISEPGNAELAISVASTFARSPLFSPKKLQNDESEKPDIIAPLKKVLSCASGRHLKEMQDKGGDCDYLEQSGTSMAAAGVSGSIAAFLSVRKEFIGQPEKVKRLFTSSEGIKLLNSGLTEEALGQLGRQFKRTKVFVSYSHHDKEWLERIRLHLSPLQREGTLDLWDDTRIRTGERWKDKITEALKSARVAVLLISADFLASSFIQSDELPELLAGAENEGVIIMSVIIKPSLYKQAKSISQFQAVNPPDKPLINLPEGEREEYWLKLAEDIGRVFDEYSPNQRT